MESSQSSTTSLDDILNDAASECFQEESVRSVEVVGDTDPHTSDISASHSEEDIKVLELPEIPKEFAPLMIEFINAVSTTFPEYNPIISKWWGYDSYTGTQLHELFAHCLQVYPGRFTDIIYNNEDIFKDSSSVNVDFLPGISFKFLWSCNDITEQTRETIWKYLQTIVLCVVGSVDTNNMNEDMRKILDKIDEETFKEKLCDTVNEIQKLFESSSSQTNKDETNEPDQESHRDSDETTNSPNLSADDFQEHLDGLVGGKIGALAKDILGDTLDNINEEDFSDAETPADIIKKLCDKDGGLMQMAAGVTEKLQSKIESGEYDHGELLQEATSVLQNMKDMPGIDMFQNLMSGAMRNQRTDGSGSEGAEPDLSGLADVMNSMMGGGAIGGRNRGGVRQQMDHGAIDRQNRKVNQITQMKQRIEKKKLQEAITMQKIQEALEKQKEEQEKCPPLTDEELIAMMEDDSKISEKETSASKSSSKKKKSKNKK
jgi:hypothetical protein